MAQEYFVGGGASYGSPYKKKPSKKLLLSIFLVVFILASVAFYTVFVNSPGAKSQKVAEGIIQNLQKSNSDAAYESLSGSFKSVITKDSWSSFVKETSSLIADGEISLIEKDTTIKESTLYIHHIKTPKNGIVRSEIRVNSQSLKAENIRFNRTSL